jgi:protein-tyrosine phosphatase
MGTLLDMCKVIDFALLQGRAAVHCHAGLGRTGVLMAAHLIWSRQLHPHEAIDFVRKRRYARAHDAHVN